MDQHLDYFNDSRVHGKVCGHHTKTDIITGKTHRVPFGEDGKEFVLCEGEYYHREDINWNVYLSELNWAEEME